MADRVLSWSIETSGKNGVFMLPAHYLESDYEPTAVRIYAETAPNKEDARFEIYDDGVSIMNDNTYKYSTYISDTQGYSANTYISLPNGANSDEAAEDFIDDPIEAGSWITCVMRQSGGGRDFTVQLELNKLSDNSEDE